MRRSIAAMLLAVASASAMAAFTCEQIKDKQTRAACIADRASKEKDAVIAKEKAAAEETSRAEPTALATAKSKALDEFIRKSKKELTKHHKDPLGAQFTDLVVASVNGVHTTLCGSVNARNSYGGYVGPKRFYLTWLSPDFPSTWYEFESASGSRNSDSPKVLAGVAELDASEAKFFDSLCTQGVTNTITKIDN